MDITSIILAGGESKRMATNKALVLFRGKPLIQYPLDLACSLSGEVIISANNHDFDEFEFPVVKDRFPARIPLCGVHAGLHASRTDWNLVLTCDMPNVTRELIERLWAALTDQLRIVIPFHDGYFEPLCGFYHRELIPLIESNIAAGRHSMLDLLKQVPYLALNVDDIPAVERIDIFRNMNEKKDL